MVNHIHRLIQQSLKVKDQMLKDESLQLNIQEAVILMTKALQNKQRVYLCGNGGSAADAQHIAAELTGRFYRERPAYAAEALHCNSSYLTAVANDYGYDEIYSRYIEGIGQPGDVLIGLSTSGNSKNIVKALQVAQAKNLVTIGMTGNFGGEMLPFCQVWLAVPSNDTPRIQEGHILMGHILCELVEQSLHQISMSE